MAIRPDYDIGTVTLSSGSADFTTTGSALQTAAVEAGDAIITPSGNILIIASITGQNSGTLFLPCPPAAAGTGLPLRIRFQPDGSRYQGAVRNMIDLLSSGNIEAFAALVGAAGMVPIFTGVGTMDLADPATFGIQDPNGSLGKLAALTLAARQILQTDENGALKQVALAASKFLRTDGNGDIVLSDLGAAAIALLNLSGTAAADHLPYLTGANGAGLTALTALARSVIASSTGAAMWTAMGGVFSGNANSGYLKRPDGTIRVWGISAAQSDTTTPFATTMPNAVLSHGANFTNAASTATEMISVQASTVATNGITWRPRYNANGAMGIASQSFKWWAEGY